MLERLNKKITSCKKCPRLVEYIAGIREKYPTYWCKPVPGFGDANSEIMILGLAPGRFGSNRTGRMFTGDSSGNFMYKILHEVGLCSQPEAVDLNDGLKLNNCYITAVGRCAPPQNKPTPQELKNCFPYLTEEFKILKRLKVVVALGKIAFDGYIKWMYENIKGGWQKEYRKKDFQFGHDVVYDLDFMPHVLYGCYHPSRQNTQTGKLTPKMFKGVFEKVLEL